MGKSVILVLLPVLIIQCNFPKKAQILVKEEFPQQLVHFMPYKNNPVFKGTGADTWDNQIRERGWILKEQNHWYLWYTGYTNVDSIKYLGFCTSENGYNWIRDPNNPIYTKGWVEDMCVVKSGNTYYMFAEGKGDTAHMLVSVDRIHWSERGNLDIRLKNGQPIEKGPYGTPSVIKENNEWYLFYEREDAGIWLATSSDLRIWTNVQDEPVLKCGPEPYDQYAVAMDQVVKYNGLYYGYYHASAFKDWHEWSSDIAVSKDMVHWKKFAGNPIVAGDKSSPIIVQDGKQFRLYTMHPEVNVYLPSGK